MNVFKELIEKLLEVDQSTIIASVVPNTMIGIASLIY